MREREKIHNSIKQYLRGMCEILNETPSVEIEQRSSNNINVNLKGMRTFSGNDQRLMKSLAYILELHIKHKFDKNLRIYMDVNSYKANRKEKLANLAKELAKRVKQEHKRIRLNPMKAYERKAIHVALSDFSGVKTRSEGQGNSRRVIIEPTKNDR